MNHDILPLAPGSCLVIRSLSGGASDGTPTLSANPRPRSEWARLQDGPDTERLRMTREFSHDPVMVGEAVEALVETPQGVIVDATLGAGGHAAALLEATSRHRLIGMDRDPAAIVDATERLEPFGARARAVHARFDQLTEVLEAEAPGEPVAGILFDLGVSSRQFDDGARGFSYRFEAPLDMRMDPADPVTAARVVNEWPERDLADLFADNGEGRFAGRIARALVAARPLVTTTDLAETVRSALPAPARQRGGHPAKRVFQALRVAVNRELELLPVALDAALSSLTPGGRAVVIAYHSGEDRIVKRAFAEAAGGWCTCPSHLPCICGAVPALRVLTRGARLPSRAEVAANPRASSARLRIAERLDAPWERRRPQGGKVDGY
ncbi:MAG: 16S rRNA (cytosine(1402)-N(4))-methyltransferase RsmH [Acidimicrobiales bacterium]